MDRDIGGPDRFVKVPRIEAQQPIMLGKFGHRELHCATKGALTLGLNGLH
jgi:hypothetical protein